MQTKTHNEFILEKVSEMFSLVKTGGFITEEGLKLYSELVEIADKTNSSETAEADQLTG